MPSLQQLRYEALASEVERVTGARRMVLRLFGPIPEARCRGGLLTADPPSYEFDEVRVAMGTGPLHGLVLELTPATTPKVVRGRIGAGTYTLYEANPTQRQTSYMLEAAPSGTVQAVAYRVQKACGLP